MKETLQNLTKAFIGESQARNRYSMYAKIARKEGYEQIAAIFLDTSDQEKQHAKHLFQHINELKGKKDDKITVETFAPTTLGTTEQNLMSAIEGERYEFTEMYPEFAATAKKEGYKKIATRLLAIANAEEHHAERYQKILKEVKAKTVFKKKKKTKWICRECGYQHDGTQPPEKCPSCDHERAFYEVKCEKY